MNEYVFFTGNATKKGSLYHFDRIDFLHSGNCLINKESIINLIKQRFRTDPIYEITNEDLSCVIATRRIGFNRFVFLGFHECKSAPTISVTIFDLFNDIEDIYLIVYSENGEIEFVNNSFLKSTGYSFNEIKGTNICDLIEKPNNEICKHLLRSKLKGEKFTSQYFGVKIATKSGQYRFVSIYGNSIVLNNKPAGLLLGVDVTNEYNIEKIQTALKNINELIIRSTNEHELLDKICSALVDIGFKTALVAEVQEDKRLKLKHFSGAGGEFFRNIVVYVDGKSEYGKGMGAKAFLNDEIVINPDTEANPALKIWQEGLLKNGFLSHCAIPIKKKGVVGYILCIFSDQKNAFVGEYLDLIRELKLDIEFALERFEREKHLFLINHTLNDIREGILITDSDCKIWFANRAFFMMFNYSKDEVIGRQPIDFAEYKGSCKDSWVVKETLQRGIARFESKMKKKDGRVLVVDVSVVPVKDKAGELNFVGILRDITVEKKQKEELKQLNRLYKTLFHLNEFLIAANNESDVYSNICKVIVDHLGACFSFLAFKSGEIWKITHVAFVDEKFKTFINDVKERINNLSSGAEYLPFVRSFETKSVKVIENMEKDKRAKPFLSEVKQYGLRKCFSIPIYTNAMKIGALVAVFDKDVPFGCDIIRLLRQISYDISAALEMIVERRWNRIVSLALQKGFSYVVILDSEFRILYVNEEALRISGYSLEEVLGKKYTILSSALHEFSFVRRFVEALKEGKVFSDVFTYRTKDGSIFYGYATVIPYKDGEVSYYIVVGKDITKEIKLQKRLMHLSNYDFLTGLPNKQYFIELSEKSRISIGIGGLAAIAIVDIRNCSYINQVYGFKGGDKLIKETANRIIQFVGKKVVVGRISGDRFSLFFANFNSEEDVLVFLTDLLKYLNGSIKLNKHSISPSYNIGVSFYPSDGNSIEDLLTKAEIALLESKKEGENEIGFYKRKYQQEVIKVIELKNNLKKAFKDGELVLFYQPYYDVKSKEIVGAESLIRWVHNGRVIPPIEFIDVLESSDLIYDVEEFLVNQAAKTVADAKRKVSISVNISTKSFRREYIVTMIKEALGEFGIDGRFLTVEIVERVFLGNLGYTKNIMEQLKEFGVRFAVDDFGTGYSSLTYIKELPIDIIKIDIDFVRGMMRDEKDLSLVKLIINLAKEFGCSVIAEGVETQAQLELLEKLGCDYAQGFLFSKPMNKEEFLKLLS